MGARLGVALCLGLDEPHGWARMNDNEESKASSFSTLCSYSVICWSC
jgi:hypothetical protein